MSVNRFVAGSRPMPRVRLRRLLLLALPSIYVAACFFGECLWMINNQSLYLLCMILHPVLFAMVTAFLIYCVERGNPVRERLSLEAVKKNPWRALELGGVLTYGI
jgi:hypothetical protein